MTVVNFARFCVVLFLSSLWLLMVVDDVLLIVSYVMWRGAMT